MKPRLTSPLLALSLCLALSVAQATNPDTPPPSGTGGSPGDSSNPPVAGKGQDCSGKEGESDPNSNSNSGDGNTCPLRPRPPCPPPSCIIEKIAIAIMPNEPSLGSGMIQYYVEKDDLNFGSRTHLAFYGLPSMVAKAPATQPIQNGDMILGTQTVYGITQAGGSVLDFLITRFNQNLTNPPPAPVNGAPTGNGAFSQARVGIYTPPNSQTSFIRQFRSGDGLADFPAAGGPIARFTTNSGRVYDFPLAGFEVLYDYPTGAVPANTPNYLRQVKTAAGLLDVVPVNARSFFIRKYAPTQVGAKGANGFYTAVGEPIESYSFSSPVVPENAPKKLTVIHKIGTETYTTLHTHSYGPEEGEIWRQDIVSGSVIWDRILQRKPQPQLGPTYRSDKVIAVCRSGGGTDYGANAPQYSMDNITRDYAPVHSKETFSSGMSHDRKRSYAPVPGDPNALGPVNEQETSTGSVIDYGYDSLNRMVLRKWTMKVPATGGTAPMTKQESYDYTPLSASEVVKQYDFRPRTTLFVQDNVLVGRTYNSYYMDSGDYVEAEEVSATAAAPYGDMNNRRTESRYFGSGPHLGRLKEKRADDATLTRYDYSDLPTGNLQVTILKRLTPNGQPLNGHSTRSIEVRDVRAWSLSVTNAHWVNGAWLNYETITEERDLSGNLTKRTRLDLLSNQSRVLLEQEWDGSRIVRSVDEAGVVTRTEYLPETNFISKVIREAVPANGSHAAQPEIVTTYSGDFSVGANQMPIRTTTVKTITSGGLTLTSSETEDEKGRTLSKTDVNGYTTTYSYQDNPPVTTMTLPSGAVQVTTETSENEILSVTGTAVIPQFFRYAPLAAGGISETMYEAQDLGPRWTRTERDAAKRISKVLRPAFNGQTSETVYSYQNGCPCGKAALITSTGQPAKVLSYNAVSQLIRSGTSGDNLTLSLDSASDRISDEVQTVLLDAGKLWLVQTSTIYPTAGNGIGKVINISRRLLAGFTGNQSSVQEAVDITGNVTAQIAETDRATKVQTMRTVQPSRSDDIVETYYAGLLVRSHSPGSSGDLVYGHDALGRVISALQPGHTQTEVTTYHPNKNQVATQADAAGASTTFSYVAQGQAGAGQVQSVVAADNGTTTTLYNLRGQTLRTSGARSYPVAYAYDGYGQLSTLTTWQDYAGETGAAITTWAYEAATGLLLSKTDAANQPTSYTYDAAGRVLTRTWARGVTSTYGYHPQMADLITVDYSDGTPSVDFVYDRLGRLLTSTTDLATQNVLSYRADNLQVETETVQQDLDGNGTVDFQRSFTRGYDAFQRSTGYSLQSTTGIPAVNVPNSSPEVGIAYSFEPVAGRLGTVASTSAGAAASSFTYVYDPARAGLISTLTGPAHTVTNTWEGEREVLDVKTNALLTAGVVSAYEYGVNSIGQRSSVATSGSAFTVAAGWAWGYDALGQVTSATHTADTAKNQAYLYDDIGNRKQSTLGLQPVSTTSYTPNLLNQYSAITGANAPAAAPTYDTDGNQLSGAAGAAQGQTFVWDAENRLTTVKDASGAMLVSYVYDSKSRRVRRTEGTQTTLYVYHGWNCIAEYSLQESGAGLQPVIQRSYAWGLDLSGSVQGAGGVGGLLSVTHNAQPAAPTFFPTYDGNGNISEYLTASGTVTAHFEYDAFGRVITSTGNTSAFDYRFSTKPQDAVTGWSYYGYRWYDAVGGRWVSRDPIEERGGVNTYSANENAPITLVDRLGLDTIPPDQLFNELGVNDRSKQDEVKRRGCSGVTGCQLDGNDKFTPPQNSPGVNCFILRENAESASKEKCGKDCTIFEAEGKFRGDPEIVTPTSEVKNPASMGSASDKKPGVYDYEVKPAGSNSWYGANHGGARSGQEFTKKDEPTRYPEKYPDVMYCFQCKDTKK
jgi:RHS repeat-associated protein